MTPKGIGHGNPNDFTSYQSKLLKEIFDESMDDIPISSQATLVQERIDGVSRQVKTLNGSDDTNCIPKKRKSNMIHGIRKITQKTKWTEVEDLQVMKAWKKYGHNREEFIRKVPRFKHLGSKHPDYHIFCYHRLMYLDHMMPTTRDWSEYQVRQLNDAVQLYKKQNERVNWTYIAFKYLHRSHTGEECRIKYYSLQDLSTIEPPEESVEANPDTPNDTA